MNTNSLASKILHSVGGEQNVSAIFQDVKELGFKLIDASKANKFELEHTEGILSFYESGDQFQVVVGIPSAHDVYKEITEVYHLH